MSPFSLKLPTEIARITKEVRGYAHFKECHVHAAKAKWEWLRYQWKQQA